MDSQPVLARAVNRRGIRAGVSALACWLVFGLAYIGNVPSFADLSCEVYCGPFDIVSASVLMLLLPPVILATAVLAAFAIRGRRIDRLAGLAGITIAALPVGILSWITFVS